MESQFLTNKLTAPASQEAVLLVAALATSPTLAVRATVAISGVTVYVLSPQVARPESAARVEALNSLVLPPSPSLTQVS